MDPSAGGGATSEETKPPKEKVVGMAGSSVKANVTSTFVSLFAAVSPSPQRPLYPDTFHGFEDLPVSSSGNAHRPLSELCKFEGFSELPKGKAESQLKHMANRAYEDDTLLLPELEFHGFEELPESHNVSSFDNTLYRPWSKLCRFEGFAELPKGKADSPLKHMANRAYQDDTTLQPEYDICLELLNDIEENIPKFDSLKRTIGDDNEMLLSSPKRLRTEDGTIWAESPNEPIRLAAIIRALRRLQNAREVRLRRREVRAENREIRQDNRDIHMDLRESIVQKKEADVEEKMEAYRVALAADIAKKSATVPETKEISVAGKIEKAKARLEAADTYTTLGEKIINIPSRGEAIVKSYEDNKKIVKKAYEGNKEVANKFKGYLGAVTTSALQIARTALVEALKDYIGCGNGGADEADVSGAGGADEADVTGAGGADEADVSGAGGADEADVSGAGGADEADVSGPGDAAGQAVSGPGASETATADGVGGN